MSGPDPAPVVTPRRRRSFFGPLLLIAIGVLFLLRNMGFHVPLFFWFARYWPVLLILWGLARLLDYYQYRQQGGPPPRTGAGAVLLVIFLVMLGMAANQASRISWDAVRSNIELGDEDFGNLFGMMGNRYDFQTRLDEALAPGSGVRIVTERGTVKVNASPDDKVHVIARKVVYAGSQSEADRLNPSTGPSITEARGEAAEGNWLRIDAGQSRGGRVIINLEVQAPKKARVEVTTTKSAIEIRGREGDVRADTAHGDVTLEDIAGNARVQLRHGSLTAQRIGGDLAVEGRIDDSTVSDVGGRLTLSGDFFGDMKLSKIAKGVSFKSSRTEMEFSRLDGDLSMASSDLRASSLSGPLQLTTRSKDIHLDQVSGDIGIHDSNAEIELRPKTPLGNISVENRKGTIQVVLPPNAGFQVEAESHHGEIESDFDLKTETREHDSRASGVIGKGGPRLQLSTDHSSIQIRKG